MPPFYTTYLITGANRGIGLGLTALLLLRPHTNVVAAVRSSNTDVTELNALPTAAFSNLVVVELTATSDDHFANLISKLIDRKITQIDTVIANAGSGTTFQTVISTSINELRKNFEINTLGPTKLFQATYPLLQKSPNPKFVFISSSLGGIESMEADLPSLAYGVSKAAGNYFVRKVHFEHKEVTSLAVHPGWVKTGNGQAFANAIGVREPPMSLEESVMAVLRQVDIASRSTTSGSFIDYHGNVIPW